MHVQESGRFKSVLSNWLQVGLITFATTLCSVAQTISTSPQSSPPVVVSPYSITSSGPHHRIWKRVTMQTNQIGKITYRTNSYTEIATGLNHLVNGQWIASSDNIEITPDGGAATNGQHQVYFPANINTTGGIHLVTPKGDHLHSTIKGLCFFDAASGQNAVIAEVQDSIGQLLQNSNQVIYPNALVDSQSNFLADVLYTHRLAGFEQDVILRQQLPSPTIFGLNPSTTRLQIWTEFFDPPEPTLATNSVVAPVRGETQTRQYLANQTLKFGTMRIGSGNAFFLGGVTNGQGNATNGNLLIPVAKEWVHRDGRTFLIEEVLFDSIVRQTSALPATSSNTNNTSTSRQSFFRRPRSSGEPHAQNTQRSLQLSQQNVKAKAGFVLDYSTIIDDYTNFVFQSDTTYYISGPAYFYETTTFEGGTVIKSGPTDSSSSTIVSGDAVWLTSPYRPAIFTCTNDDSVGQQIEGSSGTPTLSITTHLYEDGDGFISNARFSYAFNGYGAGGENVQILDCQFINCAHAVSVNTGATNLGLHNVLFEMTDSIDDASVIGGWAGNSAALTIYSDPIKIWGENVTADLGSQDFIVYNDYIGDPSASSVALTNSIILTPTLAPAYSGGGSVGIPMSTNYDYCANTNPGTIFQTVGAANYYLSGSSPCRNIGTTNIHTNTLADIQQKTTWPPIVIADILQTSNLTLFPQAQRDLSATPDIGYHYDPLDYALGYVYVMSNATVTVTQGAVIGCFGTNGGLYGITAGAGGHFVSMGAPPYLNRLVEYNTVQEQIQTNWERPQFGLLCIDWTHTVPASVTCRFTDFSVIEQEANHINGGTSTNQPVNLQDCQFHGGSINDDINFQNYNFTNCLLERVYAVIYSCDEDYNPNGPMLFRNNLVWNSQLEIYCPATNSVLQDNFFYQTQLQDDNTTSYIYGYNAYYSNTVSVFLNLTNNTDKVLTNPIGFEVGPLGYYYQPTNSPLANMGSTNANLLGLYEYTVSTNEVKEGTNIVTIGYHYVATDTNGIPDSTLWFGIPDYLADVNGDGGLENWQNKYFGHIGIDPNGDYDNSGTNNLQDYINGIDPNIITFGISLPNQYVTTNMVSGTLAIIGGVPSKIAVLLDSTNFSAASWLSYSSSNITVNVGSNQGTHEIWVGLRGLPTDAQQTWGETTVILDLLSSSITITNPSTGVSLASSRVNICGYFSSPTLQQITVNGFIAIVSGTNFEARNIPLNPGLNTVQAILQDLDGNTNSASITITCVTNSDGSLTDPVQLTASPVAGFSPLTVTLQSQATVQGTIQQVSYDFEGGGALDLVTNTLGALSYTYNTNGEYFPVVTVQTTSGRFSSFGGWNSLSACSYPATLQINVAPLPNEVSTISITDPVDIKWSSTGNLYVLSGSSSTITEFTTNGTVIRSVSDIGSNPSGLDVDAAGNVYIALTGSNQICRFNPTTTSFQIDSSFGTNGYIGIANGTSGNNPGQFNAPYDVAISPDGGTISVSDSGNNQIQQFTIYGTFVTSFGSLGNALGQFNNPKGLAYDPYGTLYIVDAGNNRVVQMENTVVLAAAGTNGTQVGQFQNPVGISVSSRGIYVADTGNNRIQKYDLPEPHSTPFSPIPSLISTVRFCYSTNFSGPYAVATVGNYLTEQFFVADTGNNRVVLCQLIPQDPTSAWINLTNRIAAGDLMGAASYLASSSVVQYQQAFLGIGPTNFLSLILNQVGTLTPDYVADDEAEYYFQQNMVGQTITFPVRFIRENGVWKILDF